MLITELKSKEVLLTQLKGKVFVLNCHGCREIRFPEAEANAFQAELTAEGVVTGSFTTEEAQDLAIVLRAGSLPTPVSILEERTVGPSLGKESINSGIKASLVGAAAVVIIMPLYYGLSGLIADAMLCFTLMILMAGMTLFGATLTLPGIAGVVLTIGMSVDANVLVFERIREEIGKKLSVGACMYSLERTVCGGFEKEASIWMSRIRACDLYCEKRST